jgi:hypothetical protein
MDSLEWTQVSDGLNVTAVSESGAKGCFALKKDIINFLWAGTPRIYFVFVKFSDASQEKCYMLDLTNVKPVISQNNGLRVSLSRKSSGADVSGKNVAGRCCIARGESYHDRFLKDGRWQSQKVWFDMYSPESCNDKAAPEKKTAEAEKTEGKNTGKLKSCPFCGEIYPSSFDVCPFCRNEKKNSSADEDVDLDLS